MKCSVITIGTELSLGLILDRNSKYLAEKVSALGIECNFLCTVKDDLSDISTSIKLSLENSDIIIISGGLGPTDDDITRDAVASALDIKLIRDKKLDKSSMKFIRRLNSRIKKKLLRQSYIPEGSTPIIPRIGSASGFRIILDEGKKIIFSIPGVPKEMRSMYEYDIEPFLKKTINENDVQINDIKIKKMTLLTTDISESEIEDNIVEIQKKAKGLNIDIGITANPGLIKIILISRAVNENQAAINLKTIGDEICMVLGSSVYGKGDTLISENLKDLIAKIGSGVTISTAESITGGLISSIITDTPGSSGFFLGGVVSYSDYAKIKLLKIDKNSLKKYGAVSRNICLAMAKNVKDIFNADYALSVSGYAGPQALKNKLGEVYCCILGPDNYQETFKKKFLGTRSEIKFKTTQFILNELRKALAGRV